MYADIYHGYIYRISSMDLAKYACEKGLNGFVVVSAPKNPGESDLVSHVYVCE